MTWITVRLCLHIMMSYILTSVRIPQTTRSSRWRIGTISPTSWAPNLCERRYHTLLRARWLTEPNFGRQGAQSTLINGKGRSATTLSADLAVISVAHGKRYRFRLVSTSCDLNFVFSIDQHPMTVIEADATNTRPHTVDSIQIFAGQRYSFVLHANQTVDNYWIRAKPNAGHSTFERGLSSAILRYEGAPETAPAASVPAVSVKPLLETALRPLVPMPAVCLQSWVILRKLCSPRGHPAWKTCHRRRGHDGQPGYYLCEC